MARLIRKQNSKSFIGRPFFRRELKLLHISSVQGCSGSLIIGAGEGQFGIWFDGDLNAGRTQRCATFDNPPLTHKSDFRVKCIECWAFT